MDHINMELRSKRSRSRTPLLIQKEFANELATESSVRVTRSTTYRSYETNINEENIEKSFKNKSNRALKNITSDYSSEDGDNEVSSTRHIDQNNTNEFIEESNDSRIYSNGEIKRLSALKVYKEAGEYWKHKESRKYQAKSFKIKHEAIEKSEYINNALNPRSVRRVSVRTEVDFG